MIKEEAKTMNDASRIALNVNAALFRAGMYMFQRRGRVSGPAPMEIGNLEQKSKD